MPKVPHSLGSHNSGLGLQEQSPILIDLADISLVVLVQAGAEFRDDVVLVSATDLIAELLANVLLRHSRASDLVIIIGFGLISVCNQIICQYWRISQRIYTELLQLFIKLIMMAILFRLTLLLLHILLTQCKAVILEDGKNVKGINQDATTYKQAIFNANKTKVDRHNANPNKTYTMEANSFAEMTEAEIKAQYFGMIPSSQLSITLAKTIGKINKDRLLEQPLLKAAAPQARLTPEVKQLPKLSLSGINTQVFADIPPVNESFSSVQTSELPKSSFFLSVAPKDAQTAIPVGLQSAPFNLASSPLLQSAPGGSALKYEIQVLKMVKNYFAQNNFSQKQANERIQKFKSDLPLSRVRPYVVKSRRILQEERPTNNSKNASQMTQYDIDWSCVSGRIKIQGKCGACYAFAAIDAVQAMYTIYYYGFGTEMSIQEILDCPKNSMTFSCSGGFIEGALAYLMDPGVVSDYNYPYTSSMIRRQPTGPCINFKKPARRFTIRDFEDVKSNDCGQLKMRLMKQPIAIGISALMLTLYKSGTFDGCTEFDQLDHAVLLVGFHHAKGWKIKNTWGTRWGEQGYAWLKEGNTCRLCEVAFYPIPEPEFGFKQYYNNAPIQTCS